MNTLTTKHITSHRVSFTHSHGFMCLGWHFYDYYNERTNKETIFKVSKL